MSFKTCHFLFTRFTHELERTSVARNEFLPRFKYLKHIRRLKATVWWFADFGGGLFGFCLVGFPVVLGLFWSCFVAFFFPGGRGRETSIFQFPLDTHI